MNDSQNPVQLQMKHPSYCIPNTLTILRNYWKHHENKQTTLRPVEPPQNAGALLPGGDAGAAAGQLNLGIGGPNDTNAQNILL